MADICKSKEKAIVRGLVCKAFRVWSKRLVYDKFMTTKGPMLKTDNMTVYSMPANLWELEQLVADSTLELGRLDTEVKNFADLHCFETNNLIYSMEKESRSFMLNNPILYPNFRFQYYNQGVHANDSCKSNFFGWFDWCGIPTDDKLDIVLDPKNFCNNSVVFTTFSLAWRRGENIPSDLYYQAADNDGQLSHYAAQAVEDYLVAHTRNGVKCFMSIEYQSSKQRTPMVLVGLTTSADVWEYSCGARDAVKGVFRERINAKRDRTNAKTPQDIISDLRSMDFTREYLMGKYGKTASQIGAIMAHHGGAYAEA